MLNHNNPSANASILDRLPQDPSIIKHNQAIDIRSLMHPYSTFINHISSYGL
ncbi:MAG: hypothetical protein DHS20C15_12880 [Planctomycetota bacterium]|nr:MAG: hypothetical protein DHS20C15_12880 [Planctomycetota bacterium]